LIHVDSALPGQLVTMTGYHNEQTMYTYTDVGQISVLTVPNSKTWDFGHNALGQVTQCSNPNGTTSAFSAPCMFPTSGSDA